MSTDLTGRLSIVDPTSQEEILLTKNEKRYLELEIERFINQNIFITIEQRYGKIIDTKIHIL